MKFLLRWLIPTLLLAAVLHVVLIRWTPELMSTILAQRLLRISKVGWNAFLHDTLIQAGKELGPGPSPDIVYSVAFYDLSAGPVRVHCVIPATGQYWSVSLYAWNTENFFVENDRTAPASEFDLVLTGPGASIQPAGAERVVFSPSSKGVVLLRAIISDRENSEQLTLISDAQRKSFVAPIRPESGR